MEVPVPRYMGARQDVHTVRLVAYRAMTDKPVPPIAEGTDLARVRAELTRGQPSRGRRVAEKFLLAAISSIPWVGGFLSAVAGIKDDEQADRRDDLQTRWLEEHQKKIDLLG